MMCYMDITFCGYRMCANKECPRRLTKKIITAAANARLLICKYEEKPSCFVKKAKP
jgi:hypothetical protein